MNLDKEKYLNKISPVIIAISQNPDFKERLDESHRTLIASLILSTMPELREMEKNLIDLWAQVHYSTEKPSHEELLQSEISIYSSTDDFKRIVNSFGYILESRLQFFLRILGLCGCIEETWYYAILSIIKLREKNPEYNYITPQIFLSEVISKNFVIKKHVISAVGVMFENDIKKFENNGRF